MPAGSPGLYSLLGFHQDEVPLYSTSCYQNPPFDMNWREKKIQNQKLWKQAGIFVLWRDYVQKMCFRVPDFKETNQRFQKCHLHNDSWGHHTTLKTDWKISKNYTDSMRRDLFTQRHIRVVNFSPFLSISRGSQKYCSSCVRRKKNFVKRVACAFKARAVARLNPPLRVAASVLRQHGNQGLMDTYGIENTINIMTKMGAIAWQIIHTFVSSFTMVWLLWKLNEQFQLWLIIHRCVW